MQEHQQQQTTVRTNSILGDVIAAGVAAAVNANVGHMDIVVKTPNGGSHLFFANKQEEEILYLIQKYNPNCLIGNNKENNEAYKEIKNKYKNTVQPPKPQINHNMYNQYGGGQPTNNMQGQQQPTQRPMMNGPVQPMNNPQPQTDRYTPPAGQPRSYSGNLNDQSTFNRF